MPVAINEIQREEIKDLANKLNFGFECSCFKPDYSFVGSVKTRGDGQFLECLEQNSVSCNFSLPDEGIYYCLCPIRIYIANELNI